MTQPTDILGKITLYNADCMDIIRQFKDKEFEIAIIDPPYGIDAAKMNMGKGVKGWERGKDWDMAKPDKTYFEELFRISKNQIIWGGNYFCDNLPISRGWIFWDKYNGDGFSFSDGELAWTSFDTVLKKTKNKYKDRTTKIHPTQKPVDLYKWLLINFAKQGDRILDTHFGSLSIGIACYDLEFELTAIELDKDYYEAGKRRLIDHQKQLSIFN